MNIFLNEKPAEIKSPCSLAEALASKNIPASTGVAVAVNNKVIPKEAWPETLLHEGDKLLIIGASYGG